MTALHLIPDPHRLGESLSLAEEYRACFEYNDFYYPTLLDDPEACRERIRIYCSLDRDRSRDTLHGAFLDVTVHSDDPRIREVSEQRAFRSMEVARELGVRAVVFHSGTIPNFRSAVYTKNWLDRNRIFWTRIAEAFPDQEILMENMFDMRPDLLLRLAESLRDLPAFGICFDYAHSVIFGTEYTPDGWLELLAPFIRHIHINDCDGLDDLHSAVGDGVLDWVGFDRGIRSRGLNPSVLIEVQSMEKQRRSLQFLQDHHIYPFS